MKAGELAQLLGKLHPNTDVVVKSDPMNSRHHEILSAQRMNLWQLCSDELMPGDDFIVLMIDAEKCDAPSAVPRKS